ncbi:MAG: 4Fe-4S dicluster domain-containing protein [Planctomycetaceae bacterium]
MNTSLNILNNGPGDCSSGDCASHHGACGGCGSGQTDQSRRDFLKRASTIAFGTFSLTLLPVAPESSRGTQVSTLAGGTAKKQDDVLFGFLVDTEKCVGTGKCLTACRAENNVPEGYSRTWVERYVHFKDGRVQVDLVPETGYAGSGIPEIDPAEVDRAYFTPKLCNQCEDAPCNQVCPVHASLTSPEGVELVDADRCIGCAYCVQACPYGMRFINPDTGNADKCTWCYHRIKRNEQPACVEACPVGARVFGRLDDPESEISKKLRQIPTRVLKEHLGTHPKLHYVGLSEEVV